MIPRFLKKRLLRSQVAEDNDTSTANREIPQETHQNTKRSDNKGSDNNHDIYADNHKLVSTS